MCSLVMFEVSVPGESFPTLVTVIGLLSGMNSLVNFETSVCGEPL